MTAGKAVRRRDGQLPAARLADGSVVMLAALFLGLPLMSVVVAGLRSDLMKLLSERIFWQSAATSLAISISAAVLALLVSMTLVSARRAVLLRKFGWPPARGIFCCRGWRVVALVLLVPPIVLATGWFLALTNFGDVSVFAPLLIVAINALMSLPFVMRVLEPAFIVHKRRTPSSRRALVSPAGRGCALVDMPALFKPMLTAFSVRDGIVARRSGRRCAVRLG